MRHGGTSAGLFVLRGRRAHTSRAPVRCLAMGDKAFRPPRLLLWVCQVMVAGGLERLQPEEGRAKGDTKISYAGQMQALIDERRTEPACALKQGSSSEQIYGSWEIIELRYRSVCSH